MRRYAIVLILCLVAGLDVQAGKENPAKPGEEVVANELIVRLMPGATAATLIAKYLPGAQIQALTHAGFFRIRVPGGLPNGISAQIAADSQVDFVEPNRVRHALVAAPNDPNYASSWWFPAVQALQAWSLLPGQYLTAATAGTGRVKVAVLDTGADCTHPDFINTGGTSTDSAHGGQLMFSASQAIVATTIVNPVCAWQDDHGHGTHVTGILAAATSNAMGVSGLGYPVQVMEFKVLNSAGSGSDTDIMNAIEAAANAGAQVVSMSLGGAGYSQALQTAINYAWQHNTLVVAAAGNDAKNELFFPAGANHAVGVSATDSGNNLAYFSNFGNAVQLAAPGLGILSTAPTYSGTSQGWLNYVSLSGTSMATPFVSALAGLVAMTTPNATAAVDSAAYGTDREFHHDGRRVGPELRIRDHQCVGRRRRHVCGPRPTERLPAKSSIRSVTLSAEPRSPSTARPSPRTRPACIGSALYQQEPTQSRSRPPAMLLSLSARRWRRERTRPSQSRWV